MVVLLQFPKQCDDRRFCFMYSIDGGCAASDLTGRFGSPVRPLTGVNRSLLGTRKASQVFEPPDEGRNLADNNIALTQAQIRPEFIVFVCIGHCSITDLSARLVIWGRSQCDGTACFPGGHEVCE